jgi:hypothetical protein
MNTSEFEAIINRLNEIEKVFGLSGLVLVAIVSSILFISWRYLIRRTDVIANEVSEKYLKEFQSKIDRDLFKFKTKRQKQINAIHDVFSRYQKMTRMINYVIKGEKFTAPLNPSEELEHLISCRHNFKSMYYENKLLFPEYTCEKIELLILKIDEFIETYESGLIEPDKDTMKNQSSYLVGIWSNDEFDPLLKDLENVSNIIESEFRKIYGS